MKSEKEITTIDVYSFFQETIFHLDEFIFSLDFSGNILNASSSLLNTLGYSAKDWIQKNIKDYLSIDSFDSISTALQRLKEGNLILKTNLYLLQRDGTSIPFQSTCIPFFMENAILFILKKESHSLESANIEFSQNKMNSIIKQYEIYKIIFSKIPAGFLITDDKGFVIEINEYAKKVFEISPNTKIYKSLNHKNWKLLNHEGKGILPREFRLYKAMKKKEPVYGLEFGLLKEDGSEIWLETIATPIDLPSYGMAIVFYDITEKKKKEIQSISIANYDQITGLPRRKIFIENLILLLDEAIRHNRKVAVIAVDIDNFKYLNESFGHNLGDLLLKELAIIIQKSIRNIDILSREGGDEFLIAVPDIENEKEAALVCESIQDGLSRPVPIGSFSAFTSVSMGVAIFPGDGNDPATLIKNADNALHQSKKKGKNNYSFYKPDMEILVKKRLETEQDLRKALNEKEFTLHFQPKVNALNHELTGAEALVRWLHPIKGMIPPLEFIPLSEETGMIIAIGEWILESTCLNALKWKNLIPENFRVSINLSAKQLFHEKFITFIYELNGKYPGIEKFLEFEITESCLMENTELISKILLDINKLGILISIDDFGTGYSSLSYLKKFPFSNLKIDKSFVKDLDNSSDSRSIVQAVIQLGHSLGLKVIAEGVETITQSRILEEMGIDELQGYYFSRPLTTFDFYERYLFKKSS